MGPSSDLFHLTRFSLSRVAVNCTDLPVLNCSVLLLVVATISDMIHYQNWDCLHRPPIHS